MNLTKRDYYELNNGEVSRSTKAVETYQVWKTCGNDPVLDYQSKSLSEASFRYSKLVSAGVYSWLQIVKE